MLACSLTQDFAALPEAIKSTLCASLFISANWMRELLNAFVDQPDVDLQKCILTRLNRLLELEGTLQHYMSEVSRFSVPGVTFPDTLFATTKGRGKPKVCFVSLSVKKCLGPN